jgi:hypothetical protein
MDILHKGLYAFMITSRWILITMRVFIQIVGEIKTQNLYPAYFPWILWVYEILWKKVAQTDRQATTTIKCSVQNMWFACLITEARIPTHIFIIFEFVWLFKLLITSDMIKCFTATQKLRNCATTICHYALFSQTVRLQKAMSKRTFFCFIAASDTSNADLRIFYCC